MRFLSLCLCALACVMPAKADPFRIQDLTILLRAQEVENVTQAILFGQPMVTGQIDRFGFNVGLRNCARLGSEDLYCTVAAFKSCVVIVQDREREEFLELTNKYNLSRRLGYLVLDARNNLGGLLCVHTLSHFDDENAMAFDEIELWKQTIDDFRAFLIDEEVTLVDPSQL